MNFLENASHSLGATYLISCAQRLSTTTMSIFAAIVFALIIASMGCALYFMMHDRGTTKRMVYSLMMRVGLSISLFLFILFAYWMNWIHSTGIRYAN